MSILNSLKGLGSSKKKQEEFETVDIEKVETIVERIKKKYEAEGIEYKKVEGRLGELRDVITEGKSSEIKIQRIEDLKEASSPLIKNLGKFYLGLGNISKLFNKLIEKFPQADMLAFYIYSAAMPYSVTQWLALTTIISLLVFVLSGLVFTALYFLIGFNYLVGLLVSIFVFLFTVLIMFLIPKQKATKRGTMVSIELPYALRHMATELKAGIGLYRTIQTIAAADYGVLSDEFSRTIAEIEKGYDTKIALRHLALRTQSKSLRNALMHIIRALKTGGNLSDIMNEIAADVSFELRENIRDFAQKMNFFGVIFIFAAIVLPVFIAILGGIRNTPLQSSGSAFSSMPLTPEVIAIIYLVVMPFVFVWLFFYIKMIQPKV